MIWTVLLAWLRGHRRDIAGALAVLAVIGAIAGTGWWARGRWDAAALAAERAQTAQTRVDLAACEQARRGDSAAWDARLAELAGSVEKVVTASAETERRHAEALARRSAELEDVRRRLLEAEQQPLAGLPCVEAVNGLVATVLGGGL